VNHIAAIPAAGQTALHAALPGHLHPDRDLHGQEDRGERSCTQQRRRDALHQGSLPMAVVPMVDFRAAAHSCVRENRLDR
jgi:hypothetical protein